MKKLVLLLVLLSGAAVAQFQYHPQLIQPLFQKGSCMSQYRRRKCKNLRAYRIIRSR